jgi:hypothetical protein
MNRLCLEMMSVLTVTAAFAAGTEADNAVLTPLDLRERGIVTLLGQVVKLRAPIAWEHMSVKIPEDPRPMEAIQKEAGPPRVSFDLPGFEDIRAAKYFRCEGAGLKKAEGPDGRETYIFGDTSLVNGRQYILTVRIRLRPAFKPELLENPAFVRQSNNPRYWSQTFSLEIISIADVYHEPA